MFIFTALGFLAQVCLLLSIAAIVISCVSVPQGSSAVTSVTCIPCAVSAIPHPIVRDDDELYVIDDSDESDATLSDSASHCAKSMTVASYTVVIDEPAHPADDLSALTIKQLKALCKERGIKGYSNLRKHELVEILQH